MRIVPLLFSLSFGCAYVTDKEYKDRLAAADGTEDCETFLVFYADADGDGFGNVDNPIQACSLDEGMVENSDDCNDSDPLQKPGAVWSADIDGDGFGDASNQMESCAPEEGYTGLTGDCDDANPAVNPDAEEDCTTVDDDDCDGTDNSLDAVGCTDFYADGDEDGFGGAESACYCEAVSPYTQTSAEDCDDSDSSVNPDAEEICDNGIDDNCDDTALGCGLLTDLTLSDADVRFVGDVNARVGLRLSYGDDVDGDGQIDLLSTGSGVSDLSIVSGPEMSGTVSLSLSGDDADDASNFGKGLATGDLNGDGQADVVLGGPAASFASRSFGGIAALFWGPMQADNDLSSPNVEIWGPTNDAYMGRALLVADVSGDDQDDLILGAHEARKAGVHVGMISIIHGPIDAAEFSVLDTAVEDDVAVRIYGAQTDGKFGTAMTQTVDWNADGVADILVGARGAHYGKGGLYAFASGEGFTGDLAVGDADIAIVGEGNASWTGETVMSAGDLDGDGKDDILVGAPDRNLLGENRGAVYLMTTLGDGDISEIAELEIQGLTDNGRLGLSLAGSQDVDGLGPGIIAGAPGSEGGTVYLFSGDLSGRMDTDDALGTITGSSTEDERDGVGAAVLGDIDYNDDGLIDLVVGADLRGSGAGEVAIFLGGGF